MKTVSKTFIANAALALVLAAGGTTIQAQDNPPPPAQPAPTAPSQPEPGQPTTQTPGPQKPAPAPTSTSKPVDKNGDGIDDVTGKPIPKDHGRTAQ